MTARSARTGSSAQGTACSSPVGTTTTEGCGQVLDDRAEQRLLEPVPDRVQRERGGAAAAALAAQREQRMGQGALGGLDRTDVVHGRRSLGRHDHGEQLATDLGELHQVGVAEQGAQLSDPEWRGSPGAAAGPVQRAPTYGLLEAPLLAPQRGDTDGLAVVEPGRHDSQRGEVPGHLGLDVQTHGRNGQGGGPPAFAPDEQLGRVFRPRHLCQREAGQVVAPRGGLGAQLGGAERAEMDVDQVEPARAGREHVAGAAFHVGQDRTSHPPGRSGADVARTSSGGGPQVIDGGRPAAAGQRQSPAQQPGLGDDRGVHVLEGLGETGGRTEQGGRGVAGVEAALQQHQLGVGREPRTLLATEHAQRLGAAGHRRGRVTGGRRRQGRGEQQLGTAGRRTVLPDAALDSLVSDPQRVAIQLSREQHLHPRHVDLRLEDAELVDHVLSVVEQGEGSRQVTTSERSLAAVLQCGGVLEPLTRRREQLLGPRVVVVGPVHGTEGEVGLRAVAEGASLPDEIAGAAQLVDGSLRRPEHVGVAADQPQGMGQPDLDAPGRHADGAVGGLLDLRQTRAWASGEHEGHAVRRTDVGGALDVARLACATDGRAELDQRLVDVAEVAQHDAGGLVGDGRDLRVGAACDQVSGSGERLVRSGQGEGQQALQVRGCSRGLRVPGHSCDLRESAVASRRHDREVRR